MIVCALPISMIAIKANAETTADETVKMSIRQGYLNEEGKMGIYLSADGAAEAPSDNTWNPVYKPVEGEGGFYYHDTLVDLQLRRYETNTTDGWFLDISLYNTGFRNLVKGECITIKGKFQWRASSEDEYYIVDIEEVTFRYEGGTTWTKVYQAPEGTEQITLIDFNIPDGDAYQNLVKPYSGGINEKEFVMDVTHETTVASGAGIIYYGSTGGGTGYQINLVHNNYIEIYQAGGSKLSSKNLSDLGVEMGDTFRLSMRISYSNLDEDNLADDATLYLCVNGIEIGEGKNIITDATTGNYIYFYPNDGHTVKIASVEKESTAEQITLSNFGLPEGVRTNDEKAAYSAGLEGKEFVVTVKNIRGTSGAALLYYGGNPTNGYMLQFTYGGTLNIYNPTSLCSSNSSLDLNTLGIKSGDEFKLSLLLTYIDSDGDGEATDANLEVKVNGKSIASGQNIIKNKKSEMGNYIYFYPGAGSGNTLELYSVQKKETTPQISIDDFGMDDGIYGDGQPMVSELCNSAIAGKRFQVEVTPYTSNAVQGSLLYYAATTAGVQDGLQIYIRYDGVFIIQNYTGITPVSGVTGAMLYPNTSSRNLEFGKPVLLEVFYDYVDKDNDGNDDDAYFRVKLDNKFVWEDWFPDAALKLGNNFNVMSSAGNTVKLNHVLDAGEVANPFKFTGVDEDSYIDENGNVVIEVAPSIGIPGNPDVAGYDNVAVYNGLPVLVGDATESTTYEMTKTDHGTFRFTIPADSVPGLPVTVTLKEGAMKNADESVELNLTADYVVYVNHYGIFGDAYITCAGEDVQLTYSSGDVNGIYLTTTDSMTVTGSAGANIYAADDKNSGFFLNGERHQEVFVRKNDDTSYYVALKDVELVPKTGDVAIITGKWELDNVFVDFATIALKYNGSAWETLAANSLSQGQITLSDFGIDNGSIPHDKPKQYAAGLDGKEFVMDITHTYLGTDASGEWALLYYGTNYGGNGYCIALRADGYSQIKNEAFAASTVISGQDLRNYGVTPGESYRLSLKLTYIDADGDGAKDDANLDVFVQGNPINEGKNLIIDAKSGTMGDYIYLYASESKHTMTGKSIVGTMINGGSVSRDTSDDEWLVDGVNATVNGTSVEQGTVLYKPGDYVINSTIGDVTMSQTVSLYHPGDVNVDNAYEVADLVRVKKHQNNNSADTVAGQLAADKADLTDLRKTLIGKTKTDDALPTEIVGATSAGTYITSVDASANGTTVIGMADEDNNYQVQADDFDDYGFDYVLDFNNNRPIKILQLTDTQTIDSSQERYEERLDAGSEAAWAPTEEIRNKLLFNYIKATVEDAQPDFILLTGDIIYGEFDDNGENFLDIVEYMDGLKIPWAPVYGNHENESRMGVEWQNEQLTNSPYCLFNARHEIEGNGNYSIGISHNGTLERVVYMMDSNGVYDPWWEADKYKDTEEAKNADITAIRQEQGFSMKQKNWYRTMALRINDIAGKTIPSILGYHIGSIEYLEAAKAACYQSTDSAEVKYTIGVNVTAQPGDSGYKGNAHLTREEPHLLDYMHEVGTDGTFIGHQHSINTSVYYDGIRWTYGVKTGMYCDYPSEMGGTLIKFNDNSSTFEVERIIVNP